MIIKYIKSYGHGLSAGVAADLVPPRTKSPRTISASGFGPLAATTRGFSPPMSDEVYAIVSVSSKSNCSVYVCTCTYASCMKFTYDLLAFDHASVFFCCRSYQEARTAFMSLSTAIS